ncbi:MAG: flagellar protein FlaG [Thermodesulfobacteria bacterium]|nr:flagellar protein FlaG [Thermodesulfobacteriota bacterium]
MQVKEISSQMWESIREGPKPKGNLQEEPSQKSSQPEKPSEDTLSPQEAKDVVLTVQEELAKLNVRLVFNVDEETKEVVVKVVNPETDEVIRQIPPEELLEIRKRLDEIMGILFDVRV